MRGHGRSRPVTSLRVASRPSRPSRLQVAGPAAHSSPRWSRSATTRLLARPTLRSLCAARVATPARAVLRRLAFGRVAAHVTSPRPRGRVDDPKRLKANTAPLPGSVCHAACGARIVPWRQPGDWAVNFRSPPLSQSARARPIRCGKGTTSRPLAGPGIGHCGPTAEVATGRRTGSPPLLRQADSASCALRSMPTTVSAHEVRAGRRHGCHGSTMLPPAGERLDSLGRRSGGGRLNSFLGHIGAEGRHFGGDRSARRRGGSVPAERSRPGSSGARLHAPHVASSLSRDVRGLRPLTIPPSNNLYLTLTLSFARLSRLARTGPPPVTQRCRRGLVGGGCSTSRP